LLDLKKNGRFITVPATIPVVPEHTTNNKNGWLH